MRTVNVGGIGELPYAMEEAVNRLRINIGFLGEEIRKIMVISTLPNEGKSLVSMHIWRQMAVAGVDTVLLDVDMRKSVIKDVHKLEPVNSNEKLYGTTNYLSGEVSLDQALYHTQFEHGDLMFNMENAVNPSIMLESSRFTKLLDELSEKYRYVFLDSPPLNLVSDGERIGSQCDGALLVIRAGFTPTSVVKASIAQLERANCPVLGVVLNRADGSKGGYYTKKYGGYGYGYYGGA